MSGTIVLADTNVISELVKSKPDTQVMRWLQTVQGMAISAITLEEARDVFDVRRGLERHVALVALSPLLVLETVEESGLVGRAWDSLRLWIK